ncbi:MULTISPECIES: hypothetical protein [Streptomyces]|uniref:Uncharacterized protein n=1 Tax=Streptomyces mordarskii TaxID=1226758 RepID=A0ABN1DXH6_9ACTN
MIDERAPLTKEEFIRIHDIGDPATLALLVADHQSAQAGGDTDDPAADPDYVPNPPYDLPAGVSSWSEWCR